jgi:hypothetical protein
MQICAVISVEEKTHHEISSAKFKKIHISQKSQCCAMPQFAFPIPKKLYKCANEFAETKISGERRYIYFLYSKSFTRNKNTIPVYSNLLICDVQLRVDEQTGATVTFLHILFY